MLAVVQSERRGVGEVHTHQNNYTVDNGLFHLIAMDEQQGKFDP